MITKQVVNLSALQCAKVAAALYFVSALPYALFMQATLGTLPWVSDHRALFFAIFVGVFTVVGFLFSLIGSWIYNLVANRVGGFEFTIAEVGHN
jgi:hypothetical protein